MLIRKNVPLRDYSSYKIGGPALYFLEISSEDELTSELSQFKENVPIFILGKGTNILIDEKGFEGLIIHNNIQGIKKNGEMVEVGAGVLVSELLKFCIENSLSGFEWAGGLPGTIGGAVRGNAGAFKGEAKDIVSEVTSINIKNLEKKVRNNKECEFSYRNSIFKTKAKDEIITSIILKLNLGDKEQIREATQEKIDYRNEKHPMNYPSIGSTFKNIPISLLSQKQKDELLPYVKDDPFPVIPVAKLLYLCNLKGKTYGGAQISEKHPNFIINLGNAKSKDVKKLIDFAKKEIYKKFEITLEEEIMYLGGE